MRLLNSHRLVNNRLHRQVNHRPQARQGNRLPRNQAHPVSQGLPLRAFRVNRQRQECLRDSPVNREWRRLELRDRALLRL